MMSEERAETIATAKAKAESPELHDATLSPEELEVEYARLQDLHQREVELTWQQIEIEKSLAKKRPPRIVTRPVGDIGRRLHDAAEAYLKHHSDKAVRWGFAPLTNTTKTKMLSHKAVGYEIVKVKELGMGPEASLIYGAPDEPVRVMDVVLMSIPKAAKAARTKEKNKAAATAATAPERIYVDDVRRKIERPGLKVVGKIKRTEEVYDVRKLPNKRKEE